MVMGHQSDEISGIAVLPRGQAGELLHGALGARHIGTRLKAQQQPAILGAALDIRHRAATLAVTPIVSKRERPCE